MEISLSNKILKGMVWSMLERISVQVVQFIIGIILARILSPSEYGIIGLLTVIIAFLQVFVDSGFSKALIQKQERTQNDISTIFFFNLFISLVCYMLLWMGSPFIADFYNNQALVLLMRVLSFSLILNALFSVPMTLLTIDLDFKSIARINLIAMVISGGVSIAMAYHGYGVWALVWQTILRAFLTVLVMWFQLKWSPVLAFSRDSFRSLYSFGSKLLVSAILNMTVNNFSNLFIAKLSNIQDLGFYTRGTQFADIIYGTFSSVLESVLLPTLASLQKERDKLIELTRKTIKSTALIVIPVLMLLAVVAKPLIRILLTDKWIIAVPIMQIICVARLISIISGINVNVLYAIGRTDLALKQQYVKLVIRIVLLSIALKFGIIYLALAELISTTLHFFVNTYYPGKILKYGVTEQIRDLRQIIFAGLAASCMAYFSISSVDSDFIGLMISLIVGGLVYIGIVYVLKIEEFFVFFNKAKNILIELKK